MWEKPYYRVKPKAKGKKNKAVTIDVTLSAPRMSDHISVLPDILTYLDKEQVRSILDFGAGKLRNALYLLKRGYEVYAVEYEQQFTQYELSRDRLAQAQKHSNFKELIFPHQFLACSKRFDLALLANVITIIPAARDRRLVLKYCHDKLRSKGFLVWISQYGDTHYKDRLVLEGRDGFIVGAHRSRATFYCEYKAADVDALVGREGFGFVGSVPFWKNQARIYQRA